jgi:hypothetical protein
MLGNWAIKRASANKKENITKAPIAHLFPISVPHRSKRLYSTTKTIPQSRIIKATSGETFIKWSERFGIRNVREKMKENRMRRSISLMKGR